MDRDELETSMSAKAAQLADISRRTDINGHVTAAPPTAAESRTDSLRRALAAAVDAGDQDGASKFAELLAQANAQPAGSADQGARGPAPTSPSPLDAQIAAAEAAGDCRQAIALKGAWANQIRATRERTER